MTIRLAIRCAVWTVCLTGLLAAQNVPTLQDRIQKIMDRPEFAHSIFGIEF
jgi:hypothetical protein